MKKGETRGRPKQDIESWIKSKGERTLKERALSSFLKDRLEQLGLPENELTKIRQSGDKEWKGLLELYQQKSSVDEYAIVRYSREVYRSLRKEGSDRRSLLVELDSDHMKRLERLVNKKIYGSTTYAAVIRGLIRDAGYEVDNFNYLRREQNEKLAKDRKRAERRFAHKHEAQLRKAQAEITTYQSKALKLESELEGLRSKLKRMDNALFQEILRGSIADAMLSHSEKSLVESELSLTSEALKRRALERYRSVQNVINTSLGEVFTSAAAEQRSDTDGEDDESKGASSNDTIPQELPHDESMSNNGDVEHVDEPNPITKEVKEKARESRELDFDGESVERSELAKTASTLRKSQTIPEGVRDAFRDTGKVKSESPSQVKGEGVMTNSETQGKMEK